MRKKITMAVLVSVMALGSIGLVACGGNGASQEDADEATTGTTEGDVAAGETTTEPTEGSDSEAVSGEFTWDDVPVYPGAEAMEDQWTSTEIEGMTAGNRTYTTDDSVDDVVDFYTSEMPGYGWSEPSWIQSSGSATASFFKDDTETANFQVETREGVVYITIIRQHVAE